MAATNKVGVVTGSSSGIGLLSALELARRGYQVVATMRDPDRRSRLDEAAKNGLTPRIDVRRLDITEFDSIPEVIAAIVRDHGRIDVLVNNAGFALGGFAEDIQLEELRQQFETNFFGHVATTKAVLHTMRAQQSGHIIMVSSIVGRVGQPVISSYCASKFALEGWSESLRIETHSLGIRVALVEPGSFETDIWTRNTKVAEQATHPDSPNRERGRRFSEFIKSQGGSRPSADCVARLIADIAEDPNPRLRYMIGKDAKIQWWFRSLVPWRRYEKMVAKAVKID
ncbi:MAG TPA: SDR family oxidoreductase [Terriglobales bacterium]|nr:SDR family oxidoreductase [Terriglobales bacterium]